jgi:rhodanese-related sulfurtransferase
VLVDDHGTRAVMTAHWLKQMGWDVSVLDHALDGAALERGGAASTSSPTATIVAAEAATLVARGAAAIVLGASAAFRAGHPPGAVWTIRPRLDRLPEVVLNAARILVFSDDPATARLACVDLAELSSAEIAVVEGGIAAWRETGLPLVASPDQPPDSERIDFVFWNHNRHESDEGAAQAMRNYLQWELDLPGEIEKDGLSGFRVGAAIA